MNTKTLFIALLTACAFPLVGLADPADASKKDRQVYNQLISEIRTAHVKLAAAYQRGVAEAKENDGQATTKTRAEIVSLRDEIDRKSVRLMLVADRHGWDVPKFNLEDFEQQARQKEAQKTDKLVDQFFPPDPRITGSLADEAKVVGVKVHLPVIPAVSLPEKD
ncbi:MAG: hypothetical protein ACLFUJ_10660 [Phycisphaerae bacterium]